MPALRLCVVGMGNAGLWCLSASVVTSFLDRCAAQGACRVLTALTGLLPVALLQGPPALAGQDDVTGEGGTLGATRAAVGTWLLVVRVVFLSCTACMLRLYAGRGVCCSCISYKQGCDKVPGVMARSNDRTCVWLWGGVLHGCLALAAPADVVTRRYRVCVCSARHGTLHSTSCMYTTTRHEWRPLWLHLCVL